MFTIVQGSLQNGRQAAPSVSDSSESQDLNLIQDIFAQTCQLDTVASIALNWQETRSCVRVLLLIHNLKHISYNETL